MKLERWVHPQHYFGASWEEYFVVLGQHRDSDLLAQSNFWAALADLGGESETVVVARANHFAVGWVETLLVHESDTERLAIAETLLERLEQYPVLDEEDCSKREWEAAAAYWESTSIKDRIYWCSRYRVSIFAARRDEVPSDPTGELVGALAA